MLPPRIRNSLLLLPILALAALPSAPTQAQQTVFSGPQPGEQLMPFQVTGVQGEQAGEKFDPVEKAEGSPTLIVFVHSVTRPGVALARSLTGYVDSIEGADVYSAVVWLDEDPLEAKQWLAARTKPLNLKGTVAVSVDGGEGPGAYGLNRNVELTVLIADGKQVKANFALVQPSVSEAPKIASELAKLVNQPSPTAEKMNEYAYPGQSMRGRRMRGREAMKADDANRARSNPPLAMLRQLVDAGEDAEKRRAVIKKIEDWAGDNQTRQRQLARLASNALRRDLGNKQIQMQLRQWQEKFGDEDRNSNDDSDSDSDSR